MIRLWQGRPWAPMEGRRLGGFRAGPGRSVADLGRLDEVELLGERINVEEVAQWPGVELEVAKASAEGREIEEVVAQAEDVEALQGRRVGQDLDDQLVLIRGHAARLPRVALRDHGAIELDGAGELAGEVVRPVPLVAPGAARLERGA